MKLTCIVLSQLLLWLAVPIFSTARAGYPAQITASSPFVNLPRPTDDRRWAEAFAHWDRRADTKEVMAAVPLFEALAKDHPNQLEAQLWLMRAYYLAGLRNGASERETWMKKGTAAGDRGLKLVPDSEAIRYWRYSCIMFYRDLNGPEMRDVKIMGAKYEGLRELTVPSDDPLWAEAIKHWDGRFKREEGVAAIAIFGKLEKKYPQRIEPKLWLARSNYWMHYLEPTVEGKSKWLLPAADWGRKAIQLEPRNPGANYWTAASLGQYATATSFANIVRYSLEITRDLAVVCEEDPVYFYGGLFQYLCIAVSRAGSVVGKMIELLGYSMAIVERSTAFAAQYEPRYLRNYLALGELYLSQGRKEDSRKMLNLVLSSDPAALKLQEPENRVAQQLAREMIQKNFGK